MLHRVRESAGITHNRNGPVTQAVHLIEAARFIARGHQENVAAGFDQVRERLIEPQAVAHAVGKALRQAFEETGVPWLSAAEHGYSKFARLQQRGQRFEQ